MKLLALYLITVTAFCQAQTIVGKWKTIDDSSGEERSIVELFDRDGLVYGKVIKTFLKLGEDPDPVCDQCSPDDHRYNKKIIGMEILRKMKKSGHEYSDGDILDPENGRVYRCKLWIEEGDLKVRGYWGPFYRTQTWKKVH
jgi:uncharacterized protein (DUF2147 family)